MGASNGSMTTMGKTLQEAQCPTNIIIMPKDTLVIGYWNVQNLYGSVHFADPQSMDYPIWTTKWTTLMDSQVDYLDGLPIWTT